MVFLSRKQSTLKNAKIASQRNLTITWEKEMKKREEMTMNLNYRDSKENKQLTNVIQTIKKEFSFRSNYNKIIRKLLGLFCSMISQHLIYSTRKKIRTRGLEENFKQYFTAKKFLLKRSPI